MQTRVRVTARRNFTYQHRAYRAGDIVEMAPLDAAVSRRTGDVWLDVRKPKAPEPEPKPTPAPRRRRSRKTAGDAAPQTYQRRDLVAESSE